MRVLLRNGKTGLYYSNRNRWVPDPCLALDFDEIEHPGLLAFEKGAPELELVVRNGHPDHDLVLPIRLEWHEGRVARIAA